VNDSPPFSPFPFYYREKGIPVEKRGGKTMIGEGGWLERTDGKPDAVSQGAKKSGILDGIKKMAKDFVRFSKPATKSQHRSFANIIIDRVPPLWAAVQESSRHPDGRFS
jgi:hypothetical protein